MLLFIQCLRRHSHCNTLRWVNRLAPFFDSYLGPLKDKHHYWMGLGLLARLILLLTSAFTLATMPFTSAAVLTVTTSIMISLVLSVYKQWQLGLLEGCFLVNMVLFSSGATVIEVQGGSKDTLACISLGISFVLFLAIIGYHMFRRCHTLKKQQRNGYEAINGHTQSLPQASTQKQPTISYLNSDCELRESLLDESSQ